MYVLVSEEQGPIGDYQEDVLGVFDSPNISDKKIKSHFGYFTEEYHHDVRDSGLEWTKRILVDNIAYRLTLLEFELNEIM